MTAHSFTRFSIDHLSPSSLNLWRSSPGLWSLKYIAKVSDKGNAGMWRGTAVEDGLRHRLMGRSSTEALAAAIQSFGINSKDAESSEELQAEFDLIEPMLEQSAKWQPPGPLNAVQMKCEFFFDPVPIPVIGYLDFAFDGIDIDLKTTKAIPSTPRFDHICQLSLYRAARGRAGGVLYVSAKRYAYYDIDDEAMEIGLESLRAAALSLNNFLSRCESKEAVLRSLPVDWNHWQAPKTKVPLSEIFLAG